MGRDPSVIHGDGSQSSRADAPIDRKRTESRKGFGTVMLQPVDVIWTF